MDFLDPKKHRAHMIRLIVGYVLIAVAILFATLILLYQAYGFGLDKDGEVIQNGLLFVSSRPARAQIYVNGLHKKSTTNTKLQLPEGTYSVELRRDGYRSWQRVIALDGGSVAHYDYPMLFPEKITTATIKTYPAFPGLMTESPDRHWLIMQHTDSVLDFDLYDLSNPKKLTDNVTTFSLPKELLTLPEAAGQTWELTEWSTDNRHVLLEHSYPGGSEYIMVDHENPAESLNVTQHLKLSPGQSLSLRDKKFDLFYVFDEAARSLSPASVKDGDAWTPLLTDVVAYKTYGDDKILYATEDGAAAGKVMTMLRDGDQTYRIREHSATPPYLLDLARYDGDWFVAVGTSGDSKVYVYKNPQAVRRAAKIPVLVPVHILKVTRPNYLAFSSNTQMLVAENGSDFATYDAETNKGYKFTVRLPLDEPMTHATWMDGHRLTYVSGGKWIVLDYDNVNVQELMPASAGYLPYFDRDYEVVYALAPATTGAALTSSSLLTPDDQ